METELKTEAYEGWAIVELMGHRVIAGQVSEASQFGAAMLRVDVPGRPGDGACVTQFYGGSAIYALTPCDEGAARKVLERRYDLPEPVRLALPAAPPRDSSYADDTDPDEIPI